MRYLSMLSQKRRMGASTHPTSISIAVLILFVAVISPLSAQEQVDPNHSEKMKAGLELFKQSVRSTLEADCLKCHNARSKKGDFDLSTRKALLDSGMLGDSAKDSYLLGLVRHEEKPGMPFKLAKLSDGKIDALAKWIDLGAPYDRPLGAADQQTPSSEVTAADRQFWSFKPLKRREVPTVEGEWARTDIDRFIQAKLNTWNLAPNESADRPTLIRRAYFDLIGLPPTPAEVDAFVADKHPEAYDRMIDRLLDSRHYGERWARHWLDVARFAESSGFEHDDDRNHAYHYRDFVIKAFNRDMPFNEFIRWQIAGDEIAPDDPLAMAATGFLTAGPFPTQITEVEFESTRYNELDDMVTNTGAAFLGLSVGCARCHDHKFDPIPTRDYYRMAATFVKTIRSEVDVVLEPASPATKMQVSAVGFPAVRNHAHGRGYPNFYENVHILRRGDVDQKTEVVEAGFIQVLMRNGKREDHWKVEPPEGWERSQYRRTGLANWITDPNYGAGEMAARVIVNRLWQHHFGRGIVSTPNDFGMQGERPTHPKLLDYLASELIANGWKLKPIHKLIMTSSVYMQSGEQDRQRLAIDPDNRMRWRNEPRRLEAEAIRDSMLAVSGLLDRTMHGPGNAGSIDEAT